MKPKYAILFIVLLISFSLSAQKKLVILHTNDMHSHIEPFPSTDKYYPGQGGVVNRKAIIDSIRKSEKNILLLDAGDVVQGTPYYNMFKGRIEAEAMNRMKYDAVTIGNHEFDYGLDTLKMIYQKLNFPVISCNYDFSGTVLKDMVKPYIIIKRGGLKIGIIGIGVNPEGLIQKAKYEGMVFKPVIETANHYAELLRLKEKCDIIICLSHIGYHQDLVLAEKSNNIDIIVGGHSHTFMQQPDIKKDKAGKDVLIYQTGKNGVNLGKIEVELEKVKR
ncbi:MAG: metallophosphoesterase [Prevotella sp.]|jgi:5'-nucleotidase|nr:metallophosphoesterase [Prevotella sp.]